MIDVRETLEQLFSRVDALEKRVCDLEQSSAASPLSHGALRTADEDLSPDAQPAMTQPLIPALTSSAPAPTELADAEQVSGAFLLLGKSMLGIAGAVLPKIL